MATKNQSKFESILTNRKAFSLVLDGTFRTWTGDYSIFLPDTQSYMELPEKNRAISKHLNSFVKSSPDTLQQLLRSDYEQARYLEKDGDTVKYKDYFGLTNVAVPIYFELELIAIVIFGRVLITGDLDSEESFHEKIERLAARNKSLQITLNDIAAKIPKVTQSKINSVLENVIQLVYITQSILSEERINTQTMLLQQERARAYAQTDRLLRANTVMKQAIELLGTEHDDWDLVWKDANVILNEVIRLTRGHIGFIVLPRHNRNEYVAVAYTGMSTIEPLIISISKSLEGALATKHTLQKMNFHDHVTDINNVISRFNKVLAEKLNNMFFSSFTMDDIAGFIAILEQGDEIEFPDEYNILETFAVLLSITSSRRHFDYEREKHLKTIAKERDEAKRETAYWFEQVLHQILNPLQALVGNADTILSRFEYWSDSDRFVYKNREDYDWLTHRIEEISSSALLVSRIAEDCAWDLVLNNEKKQERINLSRHRNVAGLLIETARHYQSMARERGNIVINVDGNALADLDDLLLIDIIMFQEAAGNIIHNAVKYSYFNTSIQISGHIHENSGIITFTNIGIPIYSTEVPKIFDSKYRSPEARNHHAPGMGIGLAVALEKIRLQGGTIRVSPSVSEGIGYKTTFQIELPVSLEK